MRNSDADINLRNAEVCSVKAGSKRAEENNWRMQMKIGDKVKYNGHSIFTERDTIYTIVDPSITCFGASQNNPNHDPEGDYWTEINGMPVCLGHKGKLTLIKE